MKTANRVTLGPFMLCGLFASLTAACTAPPQRFETTAGKMGTQFRLVLYARDRAEADAASAAAFARIDELERELSDWEPTSEVSLLGAASDKVRAGKVDAGQTNAGEADNSASPIQVGADLWNVLVVAQQFAGLSDGAFDVTVGPLTQLWRRAKRQGEMPTQEQIAAARASVGWRNLRLEPELRAVSLLAPRMRLDLGAIAKGYALDEVLALLRARGIDQAMIVGGGDIAVGAAPPDARGWRIELIDLAPNGADATTTSKASANAPDILEVTYSSVCTSGDTERFVEVGGRRFSHVIDPATGLGLERRILVTAVARTGIRADALATTVDLLGPERGLALVAHLPGTEVRVVTLDGEKRTACASPGLARMMTSSRERKTP